MDISSLSLLVNSFTWLFDIFQKKGYFSPKIEGRKSVSGYLKTFKKKIPMAIKPDKNMSNMPLYLI